MTINQFITEEILHECWHEYPNGFSCPRGIWSGGCSKCGNIKNSFDPANIKNRDFSTPTDWWYLMEFCKQQEDFYVFISKEFKNYESVSFNFVHNFIDLKVFPRKIAEFFGWRDKDDYKTSL